jgi:imidazolonepropionase-like amidohydrolase
MKVLASLLGVAVLASTLSIAHSTLTAQAPSGPGGVVRVLRGLRVPAMAGTPAIADAAVVIRNGRIDAIGPANSITTPANAEVVNYASSGGSKWLIPGLVAAHVHVSDINGTKPRAYTEENTIRQLALFARYGITTVFSLGGEQAPAFRARDIQGSEADLRRARILVAGEIVSATTPDAARQAVARVAATKPDIIKIRVDDNLGTGQKMAPEVYRAVIEEAHARGLRVSAHIFYLDDAKSLLKAGVDMIAHSVRDREIDDEFIALMKARSAAYCPTLTREVATFVYESEPTFFADPFFTKEADPELLAQLRQPQRQQAMRTSTSAQRYKQALEVAKRNVKKASDAGVLVVMGTDSGAFPERFEGYFEHLEMEMMVDSGMTPAQTIDASTLNAAKAMKLDDVGVLRTGARADLLILDRSPVENIRNTRAIADVWIAGNKVPR